MSDSNKMTPFSYSYIITCVVFLLCVGVLLVMRSSTIEEFEVKPYEEETYHSITDEVQGDAAIIYDVGEDRIIAGKNSFKPKSIASITKLPAAFIAFSHIDEDDVTVINADDFTLSPNTPIRLDDTWRTFDLLEYSLITSSNRGINAVSRTIEEKMGKPLVSMMNEFARQHNLVQTHFVNVTGLDAHGTLAGSESSAFDVARLAGIIVGADDDFALLTIQKERQFLSLDELQYEAENTNELLLGSLSETVLLSKTGFTAIAGAALVMVIEDGGKQIVLAVFDSTRTGRFDDMKVLLRMYNELTQGAGGVAYEGVG